MKRRMGGNRSVEDLGVINLKLSPTVVIPEAEPWTYSTPLTDTCLLELKNAESSFVTGFLSSRKRALLQVCTHLYRWFKRRVERYHSEAHIKLSGSIWDK